MTTLEIGHHFFTDWLGYYFKRRFDPFMLLSIPIFLLLYLFVSISWSTPPAVGLIYIFMSIICFIAYAVDKSAAISGRWRVTERTLLLLGFACGWLGAVLARQLLRHKLHNPNFNFIFWCAVTLNIIGFIAMAYFLATL